MKDVILCKFGGSSLSDANQFKKVKNIIEKDERRKFIVVSAPGKRSYIPGDKKVTDLLYLVSDLAHHNENFDEQLNRVYYRFKEIVDDLNLQIDLDEEFRLIKSDILNNGSEAEIISRGEYLSGKILAEFLGYEFVDPKELIVISRSLGTTRWSETREKISNRLKNVERAVIPGFYGINIKGDISTFSRGGSDVTGAVIARGLNAILYENWTDVDGFRMADPRVIPEAKKIDVISYNELRELSYMGASVLHEEAMIPCMRGGITIEIKNTNFPDLKGTKITDINKSENIDTVLSGISGKKGFVAINVEKMLLNLERGILADLISIFDRYNVSIEHIPTGIDSITVVCEYKDVEKYLERIIRDIQLQLNPDNVSIYKDISLLAVVGRNIFSEPGILAKIFKALEERDINVRLISQGISQISVVFESKDLEESIKAIYRAFE